MKKILFSLILFLFIVPTVVFAEDKVEIKSITFVEKSENTKINTEASTDGEKINFDLTFYDVDDYATYKVVISNPNEVNLYINDEYFNKDKENIKYEFDYGNNENFIRAGEEKTFNIKVKYAKEVPKESFRSGKYDLSSTEPLVLSDKLISAQNTLKNLGLLGTIFMILVIICIIIGIFAIFKNNKNGGMNILLIGLSILFIPKMADALMRVDIPIDAKINVKMVKDNPCTYEGNLTQGVTYVNGQYTYTYMPPYTYYDNGEHTGYYDGWGINLTDKERTDPVTSKICTSINGKNIVASTGMFSGSKASSYDISSFDFSNVIDMNYMFSGAGNSTTEVEIIGIEYLDTSNVNKAEGVFTSFGLTAEEINLDLSRWDVSNFKKMDNMFNRIGENAGNINLVLRDWEINVDSYVGYFLCGAGSNSIKSNIDLSGWYIKNDLWIDDMFNGLSQNGQEVKIDLSNWEFPNMKSFNEFFYCFAMHAAKVELIGLETWNMSNVENLNSMFNHFVKEAEEINLDLSKWDVSNITDLRSMFRNVGSNVKKVKLNLKNWSLNDNTNVYDMFAYSFGGTQDLDIDLSGWNFNGMTEIRAILWDMGNNAKKCTLNLKNWKARNVTSLERFYGQYTCGGANELRIDMSGWDMPSVADVNYMFYLTGKYDEDPEIIGFDTWDTSSITNMSSMFSCAGNLNINGLKVHADNTSNMFSSTVNMSGTITIMKNPTNYTGMLSGMNVQGNQKVIVNYKSAVTEIDNIIATGQYSNPNSFAKGEEVE